MMQCQMCDYPLDFFGNCWRCQPLVVKVETPPLAEGEDG